MTKYNIFDLWVIKVEEYYFICEKEFDKTYREIFTKEKIKDVKMEDILPLDDYYYPFIYNNGKSLMLSEKELLIKYAFINSSHIERKKEKLRHNYNEYIKEIDNYIEELKEVEETDKEKNMNINGKSLVRVVKKDTK